MDYEPVLATVSGAVSVQWKIQKDGIEVDLNTVAIPDLNTNGGSIAFKEPGEYELIGIAKNSKGVETTTSKKISVYPNAEIRLELPDSTHTDRTAPIELTIESTGDLAVEWKVMHNDTEVNMNDLLVGEMTGNAGLLQFTDTGDYTFTATVKDEHGKEFTTSQIIRVYPVIELNMTVQEIRYTDETEEISLSTENLGDLNVQWTVTLEGREVDLSTIANGSLGNTGGLLDFKEPGTFVFTAMVVDETGREFKEAKTVTVYPVGDIKFIIPDEFYTNTEVTVETTVRELADNQVVWTLLKDDVEVPIADYITGSLTETGGKIYVTQKGDYTLKAAFTDAGNRTYEHEQSFKVYSIAELNLTMPNYSCVNDIVTATVNSEDIISGDLVWTVEKDETSIPLSEVVVGTPTNTDATFQFRETGIYTVTVAGKDGDGNDVTASHTITVYETISLNLTMPNYCRTGEDITAVLTTEGLGDADVVWTVEKHGTPISIDDVTTTPLDNTGGTFNFTDSDEYKITAATTDYSGNEIKDTHTIFVYDTMGNEETPLSDWSYSETEDSILLRKYNGKKLDIVVPATYKGKQVILQKSFYISNGSRYAGPFASNVNIRSVYFSDGVQVEDNNAEFMFADCKYLVAVPVIPDGVNNMKGTFYNCIHLTTAPKIPNSVTSLEYAFNYCESLVTPPEIPDSVIDLDGAFYFCRLLATAPEIPDSVKTMNSTFYQCGFLTIAPEIPDSVNEMYRTFMSCQQLKTASRIPSSVKNLGEAFSYCYSLTGTLIIDANLGEDPQTFRECLRDASTNSGTSLKLGGTSSKLANIFGTRSSKSNIRLLETTPPTIKLMQETNEYEANGIIEPGVYDIVTEDPYLRKVSISLDGNVIYENAEISTSSHTFEISAAGEYNVIAEDEDGNVAEVNFTIASDTAPLGVDQSDDESQGEQSSSNDSNTPDETLTNDTEESGFDEDTETPAEGEQPAEEEMPVDSGEI